MSKIYCIADLHLGHNNMAIKRGFKTIEEHDSHIISNWNKTCTKRDVIWILGDITMEKNNYSILDQLNGLKKVVLGNHDQGKHVRALLEHVNLVCGSHEMKKCILTHIPIHESQLETRFKTGINMHGHLHHECDLGPKYFNVNCEFHGLKPILVDNLIKNI